MTKNLGLIAILALIITGCGLTLKQKQQVGQFATATESISVTVQNQFVSTRDKIIEIEKRNLIINKDSPENVKIDRGLNEKKLSTPISSLKVLQSYGKVLNELSSNDQSDSLGKATLAFAAQFETAMKLADKDYSLSDDKKNTISGIAQIAGSWYIEDKKKKYIKKLVSDFASEIDNFINVLYVDLTLKKNSQCIVDSKEKEAIKLTGILDKYCSSADSLKEASLDAINSKEYTNSGYSMLEREFINNSYVISVLAIEEVISMSEKGSKLTNKLLNANSSLSKVIEDDSYSSKDIKLFVKQVDEIQSFIKIFVTNN